MPPVVHRMLMVQDKRQVRRMWYTSMFIYALFIVAAALVAFDAAVNPGADTESLSERIGSAISRARAVLESGDAWALVSRWADASNRVADAEDN